MTNRLERLQQELEIMERQHAKAMASRNEMMFERDALRTELNAFRTAVEHVTADGKTTRSVSNSAGWAMLHADRLTDLIVLEAAAKNLIAVKGRYHSEQAYKQLEELVK
jgi:hypothetical protein